MSPPTLAGGPPPGAGPNGPAGGGPSGPEPTPGGRVLARHQLTPELAVDVAQASLVVLVDAVAEAEPGEILVRPVRPRPPGPATWSHHLDPETLAGLAEALCGEAPRWSWSGSAGARPAPPPPSV
jgi:hypothetical protein